ncbi:unnamed protein product [Diatraea saccharalis]|uniref:Uncharacterized protein n=1 Tax=Diatraea saccharalis TaxID=40085 RepID=A0A9N9RDJ6_9NEOP|nr:unnamed protein product [Diatraea saccharalis]
MPKTRKDLRCPLFGDPIKFSNNMLPTYCDVIKHYLWIRKEILELNNGKDPSVKDICEIIASEIEAIWSRASIPTITHQQVVSRLISYYQKYKNVKKLRNDSKKQIFYKDSINKLFDIATCKCISRELCKCVTKVPAAEENFLKDQRNERKMYIGSVDKVTTQSLRRREIRKRKYEEFAAKCNVTPSTSSSAPGIVWTSDSCSASTSDEDDEFRTAELVSKPSLKKTQQMRDELKNLATTCDRTGVSDRCAGLIVNAALLDLNVISTENSSKVVDRSKIRRERQKIRKELQSVEKHEPLTAIYFDGRKDKTLTITKADNISQRKIIVEKHISIISEPSSEYIGHLSVESGKAADIEKSIIEFLENKYEFRYSLVAIGCDGTVVNTGRKNGVIVLLEKHLKRPLQWFVCLLHANELPLRHLFSGLDGTTTGPNTFSGRLGKQLDKCLDLKIVAFEPISTKLPDLNIELLSTDQKYLYQMCCAISSGTVSPNLANKDPGKLAHSRWLTCANRILRLYIGTAKPTKNLKELATFVMKVYAPNWFDIKSKSSCTFGPIHIFNMVKRSMYLQDDLKSIVLNTIKRNAFFIHPENLLLAMLQDDIQQVREMALRRILKARKEPKGKKVREFQLPELKIDAKNYYDLIEWAKEKITEPPITMKYNDSEITTKIATGGKLFDIEKYPCHTQAVERCVKLVTEASASVCGPDARDGFIRTRIKSRQEIPIFDTKSQYFRQKEDTGTSNTEH